MVLARGQMSQDDSVETADQEIDPPPLRLLDVVGQFGAELVVEDLVRVQVLLFLAVLSASYLERNVVL